MDKKSDKSPQSLVTYFVLGMLFALLSILAKRPTAIFYRRLSVGVAIDTTWIFWLLLILSAICTVPLIIAILRTLHERKTLPRFLDFFFVEESKPERERMVWKLRSFLFGRIGILILTGGAILLLNVFLMRTNAIDDDSVNGNFYELVLRLRGAEHVNLSFSKVEKL